MEVIREAYLSSAWKNVINRVDREAGKPSPGCSSCCFSQWRWGETPARKRLGLAHFDAVECGPAPWLVVQVVTSLIRTLQSNISRFPIRPCVASHEVELARDIFLIRTTSLLCQLRLWDELLEQNISLRTSDPVMSNEETTGGGSLERARQPPLTFFFGVLH